MRVLFIGTGEIGVPVLRRLLDSNEHEVVGVVTQPDKPVGRAQRIEAPPIKSAIGAAQVPVLQPKRIKAEEAIAQIRALAPDLIVVMAYGQILPRSVLEIPLMACLNLHASLLPRHRGAAPIQAAILAGDHETGISVMYMDEGLDTGDVLLQKQIRIADNETGGTLHDRLAEIAPVALEEALTALQGGKAPRVPQDSSLATYAPKLERENGRLDGSEQAALLERKVRAFDPWPGAYTVLRDEAGRERKLKVFRAHVVTEGAGGQLALRTSDALLALDEVQLEGKRRMSAAEFLRGYPGPVRLA
jgi:methionyl-tRNA formyltransferase